MPGKDGTGPNGDGPKKNNTGIPTPRRRKVVGPISNPGKQGDGTRPVRRKQIP